MPENYLTPCFNYSPHSRGKLTAKFEHYKLAMKNTSFLGQTNGNLARRCGDHYWVFISIGSFFSFSYNKKYLVLFLVLFGYHSNPPPLNLKI